MRHSKPWPRFLPAGEAALIVELGDTVDAALNHQVHHLDACLNANPPHGMSETVPTYRSLLVHYDPRLTTFADIQQAISHALDTCGTRHADQDTRLITLPVVYGGIHGPDLDHVARHAGLTKEDVIAMHAAGTYSVAMLGFAPGFCYLLGLPEALATPRLATPRLRVAPGSVGIAGAQTGVYALETPGGWQIIGRTRKVLFDSDSDTPFKLHAGDRVRFVPVKEDV